jgi:transcriptional regulator with GAF, ATPase, and Fis domain
VTTTIRRYGQRMDGTDSEWTRALLLAMAEEHDLERLLRLIVERLGQQSEVALARVWLVAPGDQCADCPRAAHCATRVPCLHLAASAGRPLRADEDWSRVNGAFRRIPIGAFKVGITAARAEAVILSDVASEPQIARPAWIASESIRAFVGQPLCHRGAVLGVLGVFTRAPVDAETAAWLRVVADHASAAIANARALAEIARLRARLEQEEPAPREPGPASAGLPDIIGQSPAMIALTARIEQVAPTSATVLVLGESGTGKELVARAIHARSRRSDRPLVSMSCATVPRELYESELFGHVKGAFTGAARDRLGRFAAADRGTLFLDEVGEIPLDLQSKLLRVLQEGTFERVGDDRTHTVDVRIVAATNRDLAREVAAGRFREDLYYRLAVVPVTTPPLRERKEDIPLLARAFVARAARKLGVPLPRLSEVNVATLMDHDWPGNVRELENVIERAVILGQGTLAIEIPQRSSSRGGELGEYLTKADLEAAMRRSITAALARSGGKIYGPGGAAELLGVKPTTLASRIRALGIASGRRRHGPDGGATL